jgi:integrase
VEAEQFKVTAEFEEIETGKGSDALHRRPQLAAAIAEARKRTVSNSCEQAKPAARDVHFVSGLMAHKVPFIVTELSADADLFMLHLCRNWPRRSAPSSRAEPRRPLKAATLGNPPDCPTLTPDEVEALIEAAKGNRYGHRDATMILLTYRHGLRAAEVCDLRWDQVDFNGAVLPVRRVKNGTPSTHPIQGDELRALRRLQRESPPSPFVFVSSAGRHSPRLASPG